MKDLGLTPSFAQRCRNVLLMPLSTFGALMPFRSLGSNPFKMRQLLWAFRSFGYLFPMLIPMFFNGNASKVGNVIVAGVAVNVVDVHSLGDWPIVMNPNISMQPVTRPRKVFAVRRISAFGITVVLSAIEYNRLNNNSSFLERHESPLR
jgi:hypothetical protein